MNSDTQIPLAINVPVLALDIKTGSISQWENYVHAAEFFGLNWSWFLTCLCTDKFDTYQHKGFVFKFNNGESFNYSPGKKFLKLPLHEKPITFSIHNKETGLVTVCDIDQIEQFADVSMDEFEKALSKKYHFAIGKYFFKQRNGFGHVNDKKISKDEIFSPRNVQRFLSKLKTGNPKGCVEWTGRTKRGYGTFVVYANGKRMIFIAQRYAFLLGLGGVLLDPEIKICHDCDNPLCVLVSHLVPGTHKYNMLDMKLKDRTNSRYVERKLTAELAREIKYSPLTYAEIAIKYGISPDTVKDIKLGRRWKGV